MRPNEAKAEYNIPFPEDVESFELCSSDFASNLMCVATSSNLVLGLIYFPEENETNTFKWTPLHEIPYSVRCHVICFAPETSLVIVPKCVTFCVAGSDFSLRIFRTDLQNSNTEQFLNGHSNYINDIAWDYEGEFLASVSDDYTCKIWSAALEYEEVITFSLSSSGMSVRWHPEEPYKLMAAEKKGIVRFFNVSTQEAFLSIETPKFPLMYADWSFSNRTHIVAIAGGDIISWDLRRSNTPNDIKSVHEDGGRFVRFSPQNENLIASIGRPAITMKVFSSKSTIPLLETQLKICTAIAWNHRLSYIGVSNNRRVSFWKVQIK